MRRGNSMRFATAATAAALVLAAAGGCARSESAREAQDSVTGAIEKSDRDEAAGVERRRVEAAEVQAQAAEKARRENPPADAETQRP